MLKHSNGPVLYIELNGLVVEALHPGKLGVFAEQVFKLLEKLSKMDVSPR